ncbi:transposase [Streptomyces lincolnensis]|uniref:Transposase n=1 Tax=Streptomyces lincolnensis TaxID=1915 RepID=A0A1B1M2U4_STRLN|nr:transposase [Streptomyces lincolnensis]ANS62958.1 transposase [Streptomyces lincolnensis]AXG51882.1 transposase [Streptomyces lincolnensis]
MQGAGALLEIIPRRADEKWTRPDRTGSVTKARAWLGAAPPPCGRTGQALGIRSPIRIGDHEISPRILSHTVLRTTTRFCQSADRTLAPHHVQALRRLGTLEEHAQLRGVDVPLAIADAGYGDAASFRHGLQVRGLNYVVGISTTLLAQPADAVPGCEPYSGNGRPPVPKYPDPARSVKELVIAAGRKTARPVQWREGSRPGTGRSGAKRMYSRFVALRIRLAGREIRQATDGPELPVCRLLAEWPASTSEPVQFWLYDLPADTTLTALVRPAKLRRRIEHDYREMKQALGLGHFEGRTWGGWHHHVTLVSVAHTFCTLQRLARGPKRHGVGLSLYQVVRDLDRRLTHL